MGLMLVKEFVKNLTFAEIKLKAIIYELKVTEFNELYMISFTDKSNLNEKIVREMNGVIFEKGSNEVIHHSFQKAYEGVSPETKDRYAGELDVNMRVEISTEGSHIKMYHYNNQWNFGTSRNIEASVAHWGSEKSFKEMFLECVEYQEIDLNQFPTNLCYSWVMQHPLNKICYDITTPYCGLLNSVDPKTGVSTSYTDGFVVNKTPQMVIDEVSNPNCNMNYIIYTGDGKRIKIMNTTFTKIRNLVKNDPNITRAYVRCLLEGNHEELWNSFPSEQTRFTTIENSINDAIVAIHKTYMEKYVHKLEDIDIDPRMEKTLGQLHWGYRKTKDKVTRRTVKDLLFKLPLKVLMWVLYL
jgi:hypothetical protein